VPNQLRKPGENNTIISRSPTCIQVAAGKHMPVKDSKLQILRTLLFELLPTIINTSMNSSFAFLCVKLDTVSQEWIPANT